MQTVGVMGGKWHMPLSYPGEIEGNAGDMIHTMAPLEILSGSVYSSDPMFKLSGARTFRQFVNDRGTHLVIVLANILRNGREDGASYARLQNALEKYNKPIVVFGLGMQSATTNIEDVWLPREAVELMQFLSSRAPLLGVRGEFTKRVLVELCGVKNAFVTGCPSLYSRPTAIRDLWEMHKEGGTRFDRLRGVASANVTNLARESERRILASAIRSNHYLVEPVSRVGYEYHVALQRGEDAELPYYFKAMLKDRSYGLSRKSVEYYYRSNYRYFRHTAPWLEFNSEFCSWSYGSRFHVNMATLLSGRPALWLTHDARTVELTSFMGLPNYDLESASELSESELYREMNLDLLFDKIPWLFQNFSTYLSENGLNGVASPI